MVGRSCSLVKAVPNEIGEVERRPRGRERKQWEKRRERRGEGKDQRTQEHGRSSLPQSVRERKGRERRREGENTGPRVAFKAARLTRRRGRDDEKRIHRGMEDQYIM